LLIPNQVHEGITAKHLKQMLAPVVKKAILAPHITFLVFFDEVNTGSCLGLFQEIINDQSLGGKPLPSNIFWVGAINPPRKQEDTSLQQSAKLDTGALPFRDLYNVRQLPPVLQELIWDFAALSKDQERAYIEQKLKLTTGLAHSQGLLKIVIKAQDFVREWYGPSAVSQRDLKRVFKFVRFFQQHSFDGERKIERLKAHHSAILAVAVVREWPCS
jgi:hypothetical protein